MWRTIRWINSFGPEEEDTEQVEGIVFFLVISNVSIQVLRDFQPNPLIATQCFIQDGIFLCKTCDKTKADARTQDFGKGVKSGENLKDQDKRRGNLRTRPCVSKDKKLGGRLSFSPNWR